MPHITPVLIFVGFALSPCLARPVDTPLASEATQRGYAKEGAMKGLVILSVNWDRKWGCGGFQNAELRELNFDHLPTARQKDDEMGDLVLEAPLRHASKPDIVDYAILVEPGEYALSFCSIKVGRSESDVGYIRYGRRQLMSDGKAQGGSFTVAAGESVYIGHFFLECAERPTLWRSYEEGRENFRNKMTAVRRKYPFLEVDKVQFRLFRTKIFGNPYELPSEEKEGPVQSRGVADPNSRTSSRCFTLHSYGTFK